MIGGYLIGGLLAALTFLEGVAASEGNVLKGAEYPAAPRSETVDEYHGTRVPDPFRPLEDADSPETRAWVVAENQVTFRFLESIPERSTIRRRLTELWNYEKYDPPFHEGSRYFFTHNSGLQNQKILYTCESLDDKPRVLLDPNTLSADGTVALAGTKVSASGRYLAYGVASAGSDWNVWKVRDVATGKDLSDVIQWIKFSSAEWSSDSQGFFYGRFPQPKPGDDLKGANYYQKVYYHRLDTPQSADRLEWEDPDHKDWQATPTVTDDNQFLVLTIARGTDDKHRVLFRPYKEPAAKLVHLVGEFDAEYTFIDNDGPVFLFKTNKNAARGKVIAIDTRKPEPAHWVDVIPEDLATLEAVDLVGDRLLARYLKDARTVVRVFGIGGGRVGDIEFPGLGTATGFAGKRRDKETFYAFTSFTTAPTSYRYDVATGQSSVWRRPAVKFQEGDYETAQAFYASRDGTKIPIFLSHKRGLKKDGLTPTLLYGYGGFNIPMTPMFSPQILAWMEMGGLYAVANLRGGGEYGEEWHQGGTRLKKQNVFDDFIAAAQWLISNHYTKSSRLAISGRSNGGLLVGACLTQRPDLYGAALPAVGVMDMLRFHKFTIGWAWVDDYGSADHPEQFRSLLAYSPLHNIRSGTCYPPTLITTADHDDRVVPAHSFKFAATLQAAQSCDNPILIRIETKAGHGAGKPTSKLIDEFADQWAFLVKALKIELR